MRTIKFRGKRLYDGEWVYGYPLIVDNEKYKSANIVTLDEVYPDTLAKVTTSVEFNTLGQFTGLHDKNGKAIYEGDILGCDRPNIRHLVFYCEKEARFKAALNGETKMSILGICGLDDRRWIATKEVIGNIHDNPELLGEKGGEQ